MLIKRYLSENSFAVAAQRLSCDLTTYRHCFVTTTTVACRDNVTSSFHARQQAVFLRDAHGQRDCSGHGLTRTDGHGIVEELGTGYKGRWVAVPDVCLECLNSLIWVLGERWVR